MDCYFELVYNGKLTDQNKIHFYDVAQALVGFERTIALTTHLLMHGEVLTQSPSTTGFQLLALPAEPGSWKWPIGLALASAIHAFGTAPPDTTFGWLAKSAVEYVIQETLGFSPDFGRTLGPQIEEAQKTSKNVSKNLSIERFDSLMEKTESGVRALHRPIVASESASVAQFAWKTDLRTVMLDVYADSRTYEFVDRLITSEDFSEYRGVISSYNSNTYKGRIYIPEMQRTVPFELSDNLRNEKEISQVTSSLVENATARARGSMSQRYISVKALRNETNSGRLKSILVVEIN